MILLGLIFYVIPPLLFFSPLLFLIGWLFSIRKKFFLSAAVMAFVVFSFPVSVMMLKTAYFRNDVKGGKYIAAIADNEDYRNEFIKSNRGTILAIPEKHCGEECRDHLTKVSQRLNYVLVPPDDRDQILPIFKMGSVVSRAFNCFQNGERYFDILITTNEQAHSSPDMFERPPKQGYVTIIGVQLREPIPEILESVFSIFGIPKDPENP